MGKRLTTEIFLERAKELHGDKYDYSNVIYIGSKDKVEIYCKKHQEFFIQSPKIHLGGSGCPKCGIEFNNQIKMEAHLKTRAYKLDNFIKLSNELHNFKYDYSKAYYINNRTPISIICHAHGEFKQTPNNHLGLGKGCPKCAIIKRANTQRKTTSQFIEEASKLHNLKYDYSKVDYISGKVKVEIICPTHGSFWQIPNDHLRGKGCKKCSDALQDEKYITRYAGCSTIFYVIYYKDLYKIGITTKSVKDRYRYEVASFDEIDIIHNVSFDTPEPAVELEALLLSKYQMYKFKGDNIFKKTNNTEVFEIDIYAKYLEELVNG